MIIHILAGGPSEYCADFARYENEEVVWAAVDRGVYRLLKKGITGCCVWRLRFSY